MPFSPIKPVVSKSFSLEANTNLEMIREESKEDEVVKTKKSKKPKSAKGKN